MSAPTVERVRKRRDALRASGLRPVQIWAPDTRTPGFAEECRRQSRLISAAEKDDRELELFMETAIEDLARSGEWR